MTKRIYCHFSFKRPRGKDFGYFSTAFFSDYQAQHEIVHFVRKQKLWKNHQWVTSIQSYEHALRTIYECQGAMKANGFTDVILITDNSILAGWIEDAKKSKEYKPYMKKAIEKYRVGGTKEINMGVGLGEVRRYEKSYKYCNEESCLDSKIEDTTSSKTDKEIDNDSHKEHLLDVGMMGMSVLELEDRQTLGIEKPSITGMKAI